MASEVDCDESMTGMLLDANVPGLPQASFPASALSDRSSFSGLCFPSLKAASPEVGCQCNTSVTHILTVLNHEVLCSGIL